MFRSALNYNKSQRKPTINLLEALKQKAKQKLLEERRIAAMVSLGCKIIFIFQLNPKLQKLLYLLLNNLNIGVIKTKDF